MAKNTTRVHQTRVGPSWMDPIVAFLKDEILPEVKSEAEKFEEAPLDSGCPRITSYTGALTLGRTCCAFTRRHQSYYWRSYTKGSAVVTQGEDPCYTEPLPRVTGGRRCRRKLWSMLGNVTNARGLPRASINQARSSTLCPAHGHSPNGA